MQKNTKEKNWQVILAERAARERELRRAKRQCMVLGVTVIVLVGTLSW